MIHNKDKMLPHQRFNSHLYQGNQSLMASMFGLLSEHCSAPHYRMREHHRVASVEMSTPPIQVALLKFFIDLTGAKTFLEVGTFIGHTTMCIAEFIGTGADVTTIEKFDEFASIAKDNFADNHMSDKIHLLVGDAVKIVPTLKDGKFDIIYIDGDKGKYPEICKAAEKKLSPGGLIIVDDVFFHGDVFNDKPKTEKGRGCKFLLDFYKNRKGFSHYVLPVNNGILLLNKL